MVSAYKKKNTLAYVQVFSLIIIAAMLCLLSSCREGPKYGKLEGMWQIMEYYAPDGDLKELPGRRYFAFQRNVVQLHSETGTKEDLTGNLYYNAPHLHLDFPYAVDNAVVTRWLEDWGFYSTTVELTVKSLSSDHLTLTDDDGSRWECRRF